MLGGAQHVDEADLRPLQLAFVPLARRRVVERRFLDREHAVEIVRPRRSSRSTRRSPLHDAGAWPRRARSPRRAGARRSARARAAVRPRRSRARRRPSDRDLRRQRRRRARSPIARRPRRSISAASRATASPMKSARRSAEMRAPRFEQRSRIRGRRRFERRAAIADRSSGREHLAALRVHPRRR